ncbi:hypothetical protein FA15DRAFT_574048, partial [Coprinopsis marcescibilis]
GELQDSDIPHRTHIRARIGEIWEEHLSELAEELQRAVGKISFTTDIWSDTNLASFMAITAHWI